MPHNIMSKYTLLKPRITMRLIKRLIRAKSTHSNNKAHILNLSMQKLKNKEPKQLKIRLEFSFVDKNKHLKKWFLANSENHSHRASNFVS